MLITVLGWIVWGLGAAIAATWSWGIRRHVKTGAGVTRQTITTTMLFALAVLSVPVFDVSPFHLLWVFPVGWLVGTLSLAFPLSLLRIPANLYGRLCCLGLPVASKYPEFISDPTESEGDTTRLHKLSDKQKYDDRTISSGPDPSAAQPTPVPAGPLPPSWNGGFRRVVPAAMVERKSRVWLHLLLFALTVVTTTVMGGWIYSVSLLTILTAHEFGHYFAARYHRVTATLPYFIPFPSFLGTLGAVIRMSPYIPSRRALFDIAAAGPIAGLVVAIPLSIAGVAISDHVPAGDRENVIILGDPLLFRAIERALLEPRGEEVELLLHPVAFAGWVGLFVTALNLLPISQLDGGHISYALFGRKSRLIAGLAFVGLALVTLSHGYHYSVMLILLWFMGIKHPPTLNDSLQLGRGRRIAGVVLGVIFVLSFTPSPFQF